MQQDLFDAALRANDFDPFGHLNSASYLEYLESGRWSWAQHNGITGLYPKFAAIVVELQIHYIKAVRWKPCASVTVRTELDSFQAFSFRLRQDVLEGDQEMAKAKLRLALVEVETDRLVRCDGYFNERGMDGSRG